MSVHDRLKEKLAGGGRGYGWKPKEGTNRVFVLPPAAAFVDDLEGVAPLAFQTKGHYFKIEGRQTEVSRCLQEIGGKCPACAVWRAFKGSDDPGLKEMARAVNPVDAYVFNIIDLNDLGKGVQRWAANWTCWSKIMEIASNPAWGYVYDPRNGVAFEVTLTGPNKSRTGHNAYSAMPEPQRLNVYDTLLGLPNGLQALDGLEAATMETKTAEEIQSLLDELGFPPTSTRGPSAPAPRAAAPSTAGPTPVGPAPVGPPAPVAAPRPVSAPTPVGPTPVTLPGPATPRPIGFVQPAAVAATPAPRTTAHYDPGPQYVPKFPVDQHPEGAPMCFGDYSPTVHRCGAPCPVVTGCQKKMLGIK